MRRRMSMGILAGAVLVVAALAAAAVSCADITSRAGEYRGAQTGEVLIGPEVVLSIRTGAGGMPPPQHAQLAAERLRNLPAKSYTSRDATLRAAGGSRVLSVAGTTIITVSPAEARAHGATVAALAEVWRDNVGRALARPAADLPPGAPPGQPAVNWESTKNKWVPILSVEQQGVRVGAAQVAGPSEEVDRVKAVAELRLDFRGLARIYAYVPVSTLSVTKLDRVQGVSVWATGDIQLVGF